MTADIEVCDVEYSANEQKATATTAEVVFNKDCTTDTVTVCQPENADGTQECQEVEQETCFNEPAIEEVSQPLSFLDVATTWLLIAQFEKNEDT